MQIKDVPLEYMLDAPLESLSNLQLQGLAEAANLRKEIAELEEQARRAELTADTTRFMMLHRQLIQEKAAVGTDWTQRRREEDKRDARNAQRRERRRWRSAQRGAATEAVIRHRRTAR